MPTPELPLAWGSMSIRSVVCSVAARDAARFTDVVVLPTPPFWLATAITLPIQSLRPTSGAAGPMRRETRVRRKAGLNVPQTARRIQQRPGEASTDNGCGEEPPRYDEPPTLRDPPGRPATALATTARRRHDDAR